MTDNSHQGKGLKYSLARQDLKDLSTETVVDVAENGPDNTWQTAAKDELSGRK